MVKPHNSNSRLKNANCDTPDRRNTSSAKAVPRDGKPVSDEIQLIEEGIIFENVALARTLHARVEIGEEIPVDLYAAVAEIVAAVFRADSSPKRAA